MSAVEKRVRYLLFIAIAIAVALCLWYPGQKGIKHLRFLWQKRKIERELAVGIRSPDDATREIASLKFMNKDYDGAINLQKGLVAKHPDNPNHLAELAMFEAQKILSLRRKGLEPSPALLKDAEEHANRAKTLLDSEFDNLSTGHCSLYFLVGGSLKLIGQSAAAKECFEKGLKLYEQRDVSQQSPELRRRVLDEIDQIENFAR